VGPRPVPAPLLAAGVLLALQACATPAPPVYGPIADKVVYGYRDHPSGDGGHTVLAVVPAHSSLKEAQAFWDRRAGELCPGGVAKRIVFRSERKEFMSAAPYVYSGTGFSSRATTAFEVEGYVYCKPPGG
jgi:hypothetical protein